RVALGNVYNLEKKPEEAIKEFDAALTQNPRDPRAVTAKVATLVQQERVDDAIAVAQAAVQTDPKSAAAHELLGRLYALKRNAPAAEKALTEALQLDERFVPARLTLARLAVANGKPADAVQQLQRVLKDQPNNIAAAMMLAELHAREFRYDQAIPRRSRGRQAGIPAGRRDGPGRQAGPDRAGCRVG